MQWLTSLKGSTWTGRGELWLDPEGDNTEHYDCSLRVETDAIYYTWSYEHNTHTGNFTFNPNGASWVDSWHQPEPAKCIDVPNAWGHFTVIHSYEVPSNPRWGWQSKLSERPDGKLVLQMSNLAPWGEEGRAVRMIFTRIAN